MEGPEVTFSVVNDGHLPRAGHGRDAIAYAKTYEGLHSNTCEGMGKASAVYVRDADLPLWERAERYARKHRMPMSGLIMAALEAYLAEADPPEDHRRASR